MFFVKFLKSFAMIFIIANIFFIDYFVYTSSIQQKQIMQTPSVSNQYATTQSVESIQEQTHTLQTKVANIEQTLSVTPAPQSANIQTNVGREFFIPFGSGSSQAMDWTSVPGLQSYIDTSLYPRVKKVTFEVGGHTPTGNQIVNVQLYNVTNNHVVWNSQVSWTGGGSQYMISNPITLDSGNTLYEVQMQTQVGAQSFIDQAKVHIVLY